MTMPHVIYDIMLPTGRTGQFLAREPRLVNILNQSCLEKET